MSVLKVLPAAYSVFQLVFFPQHRGEGFGTIPGPWGREEAFYFGESVLVPGEVKGASRGRGSDGPVGWLGL
jgi:hypothetical protein